MRSIQQWVLVLLAGAVAGGMMLASPASAQEERDRVRDRELGMRLERLERHVRMLTERQEDLNAALERGGPPPQPGQPQPPPRWMPQGPRPGGPPAMAVNWPGPRAKRAFWKAVGLVRLAIFILIVVNISLAVWVFGDIKKRGEGHGIFIVLVLLAGIPAAILYALVRIGDRKASAP